MKPEDNRLENIQIQSPCSASWKEMLGGDKQRHCEACDLKVHNLAAMSRADGEALLAERTPEARLCVRMEFHPDGSHITADNPASSPKKPSPIPNKKVRPGHSVAAALALGAGLLAACTGDKTRTDGLEGTSNLSIDEVPAAPFLQGSLIGEATIAHPVGPANVEPETPPESQQLEVMGEISPPQDCQDAKPTQLPADPASDPPSVLQGKVARPSVIMGSPAPRKAPGPHEEQE